MRIAILSDTHGRERTVRSALALAAEREAELIVHCGDIDDAETARLFPACTHFVFGNCDTSRAELSKAIRDIGATLHEGFGYLELAGTKMAFVHGDDKNQLRDLVKSDAFDFVFYGHTHIADEHLDGRTRVINPGALHRAATKTFVVLDLPGRTLEHVTVE
jgi:uncharacterized protein